MELLYLTSNVSVHSYTTLLGYISKRLYLSLLDLLFLLLEEPCRDAADAVLCAGEKLPQLPHEVLGVFGVEEARHVDLHVLGIGVLEAQQDARHVNPRLLSQHVQHIVFTTSMAWVVEYVTKYTVLNSQIKFLMICYYS
jgi:hypothetical protein